MAYNYAPYADEDYYVQVYGGENEPRMRDFIDASRKIDTLTFNRIVGRFSDLSAFQQDLVHEVCCKLVDFQIESGGLTDSAFSSYSINGVSMALDKSGLNLIRVSGVALPSSLYEELKQTGLTGRCI